MQFSNSGMDLYFRYPERDSAIGYYHCEAENKLGLAQSNIVRVDRKMSIPEWAEIPVIKNKLDEQLKAIDTELNMDCSVQGNPLELLYFQSKNILRIERLSPDSEENYACNASNKFAWIKT